MCSLRESRQSLAEKAFTMNAAVLRRRTANSRPSDNRLAQVIEPLASYICAVEHPRVALEIALEQLFREVERTNRLAVSHVRARIKR